MPEETLIPPTEPPDQAEVPDAKRQVSDDSTPLFSPAEPPGGAAATPSPGLDQAAIENLLAAEGSSGHSASPDAEATQPEGTHAPPADVAEPPASGRSESPGSSASGGLSRDEKLDLLVDVPLTITAELGRTILPIADILSLDIGSVIELDRAPAEPIDLLVNGQLVAKGEVVVVDDNFGVRITGIVSAGGDSPSRGDR